MSSVLFDVPGPRARLRYRLFAVLGAAVLLALIGFVLYRFYDSGQFAPRMWEWIQYQQVQIELLERLGNTLKAFALAALAAVLLGAVLAAGRLSDHAVLRVPAMVVTEIFRAIPLLIMMFLLYFGLGSAGFGMTQFMAVVIGLTLYNGSVLAEVFRAGVASLPRGQAEAAYALGMRKTQVMVLVLLPQALRAMLPTIISQLVVLLKDTALGFIINYEELLNYVKYLGTQGQFGRPLVPMTIVAGAMYIAMCLLLTWLATWLEKRNRRSKKVVDRGDRDVEKVVLVNAT
ncbi:amino acid ABC transporter permease [Saccharothrix xinjiangensis]|uniref:Amino acid ABC transporter permease n=1 Tax=Saccharothrix xinjiangensis TaxID=204798 RepID=A0ABV9XQ19_9PSEU